MGPEQVMHFIGESIKGREYGKFVFTRSLSHILLLLSKIGERWDIEKEDMAHLDFKVILNAYANLSHYSLKECLEDNIARNQEEYKVTEDVRLPPLITSSKNVYHHTLVCAEPNFVTSKEVTKLIILEDNFTHGDLQDKIVFIKSADPGYDWLFSRNIAGLITQYGGINSHMAIRCAELNIPAVIGCGEKYYDAWSRSNVLNLNCQNKQFIVVQ